MEVHSERKCPVTSQSILGVYGRPCPACGELIEKLSRRKEKLRAEGTTPNKAQALSDLARTESQEPIENHEPDLPYDDESVGARSARAGPVLGVIGILVIIGLLFFSEDEPDNQQARSQETYSTVEKDILACGQFTDVNLELLSGGSAASVAARLDSISFYDPAISRWFREFMNPGTSIDDFWVATERVASLCGEKARAYSGNR